MPTFDREIAKQAERMLIRPRAIDYRTGVFASEVTPGVQGEKPCTVKMIDAKTKEHVETLELDAVMIATGRVPNTKDIGLENIGVETNRGFISVDENMRVKVRTSWRQRSDKENEKGRVLVQANSFDRRFISPHAPSAPRPRPRTAPSSLTFTLSETVTA